MFFKAGTYNGERAVAIVMSEREASVLRLILGSLPIYPSDGKRYPQPQMREDIQPFVSSLYDHLDNASIVQIDTGSWSLTQEWTD